MFRKVLLGLFLIANLATPTLAQPAGSISQIPSILDGEPSDRNKVWFPVDDLGINKTRRLNLFHLRNLITGPTVKGVANLADLTGLAEGTVVQVLGFSFSGDGGGGFFRLDTSGNLGAGAADGGVIFVATGGTNWYWRRIIGGQPIIPQWWGAVGDADDAVQSTGTNDGPALQAWLDFMAVGYFDNDEQSSVSPHMSGYLPAGVYRTNQALTLSEDPLNIRTHVFFEGAGMRASILAAGQSMTHILKLRNTSDSHSSSSFANIGFAGMTFADYCLDGLEARYITIRNCYLDRATVAQMVMGAHTWRVQNCIFRCSSLPSDDVHAAKGLIVPTSTGQSNAQIVQNCSFSWPTVGLELQRRCQGMEISGNSFDQARDAGIYIKEGCYQLSIHDNYFEACGYSLSDPTDRDSDPANAGVEVETDAGVDEEWHGAIVLGTRYDAITTKPESASIYDNHFTNCSKIALCSIGGHVDINWRDNNINPNDVTRAIIDFHKNAAAANASIRTEISHASTVAYVNTTNTAINSADSGANTITVNDAIDLAPGLPMRVWNSLSVGGLTEGQLVFAMVDAESATTFQVSDKQARWGFHTGADAASVLTYSRADWGTDQFVDWTIFNETDGSSGTVTANTGTTITAALSGGTNDDWDQADRFLLVPEPLPISGTGTGVLSKLSNAAEIARIVDVDSVTANASGLIVKQYRGAKNEQLGVGNESLGGNPGDWVLSGVGDISRDATLYDGLSPIYHFTGAGSRTLTLDISQQGDGTELEEGMRGKYFRVNCLAKGDGGTGGLTVSYSIKYNGESTFVERWSKATNDTAWDGLSHLLAYVPYDALEVQFVVTNTSGATRDALFTRFSIADATLPLDGVPIVGDPRTLQQTLTTAAPSLTPIGSNVRYLIDSTSNAVDPTLGDGEFPGQRVVFLMTEASFLSTITVTDHETTDPETFTVDAVDEFLILEWVDDFWATIALTATPT